MRENLKISIVIKNVIESEDTLVHKAVRPINYFSNTFTHYQAEQIKKGVICVQILLEIRLTCTQFSPFQSRLTSSHTVLVIVNYCRCYICIPAYPSIQ